MIGLLDSGVGGLSVYAAVRERLSGVSFAYVADNAHYPYGLRTDTDLVAVTAEVAERFVARCPLSLLVVACNTASTVVLPCLRETLSIPVVGVVPAIKPAAALTRTGTIGLLATPGTVRRPYTDELIASYAAQCRVIRVGANGLVALAERKLRGESVDPALLAAEIEPLFADRESGLDTVVLGCTHFPLLTEELAAVAPWPVRWVDSGAAVAARTARLYEDIEVKGQPAPPVFYVTRLDAAAGALAPAAARLGFAGIQEL